jgi:hypothetical protein
MLKHVDDKQDTYIGHRNGGNNQSVSMTNTAEVIA